MNVALPAPRVLRIVSLFAGGGGLDLGVHLAARGRARTVVYVERDAYAAACLVARMEEASLAPAPVWDDAVSFSGRPWSGVVDCLAFGSPCQDLSVAGRQAGLRGSRSGLFFEGLRIADECEAPLIFWENVGGASRALPDVFAALEGYGYTGCAVGLRASDVGAPHGRRRIFVLAIRRGADLAELWPWDERNAGVGNPASERGQGHGGRGLEEPRAPTQAGLPRCGRSVFPPGPGDDDGWREWLAAGGPAPAESRIRRGADGLAGGLVSAGAPAHQESELAFSWADRLRLLGNGVVPQQAAAALVFLVRRLRIATAATEQ